MFFESRRSSREGMIAVGTVVMNRLKSGEHGDSICAVVGERGQFAPGVLTRRMNSTAMPDVEEAAEAVLKGERAPKLKNAMHFHTAGLRFPYKNMHYVEVAGGNAFYEKRGRNWQPLADDSQFAIASAAPAVEAPATQEVLMASAAPVPSARAAAISATQPQPMPEGEAVAATHEPDPTRFGDAQAPDFDTTDEPAPVMTASADIPHPVMTFQATPDNTDAIGAMIMSQMQR
jgi:spore germination cell wall hydrolase CwlJ-like protein